MKNMLIEIFKPTPIEITLEELEKKLYGRIIAGKTKENILNDLEITKQFGSEYRSLTSDEKIAIYYLLKDNNIPLTFENFNVAVNEYASNRLFLARR